MYRKTWRYDTGVWCEGFSNALDYVDSYASNFCRWKDHAKIYSSIESLYRPRKALLLAIVIVFERRSYHGVIPLGLFYGIFPPESGRTRIWRFTTIAKDRGVNWAWLEV